MSDGSLKSLKQRKEYLSLYDKEKVNTNVLMSLYHFFYDFDNIIKIQELTNFNKPTFLVTYNLAEIRYDLENKTRRFINLFDNSFYKEIIYKNYFTDAIFRQDAIEVGTILDAKKLSIEAHEFFYKNKLENGMTITDFKFEFEPPIGHESSLLLHACIQYEE